MNVRRGELHGVLVFSPQPFVDERGFFTRTFDAAVARANGLDPDSLVQDSQSRSRVGVVRGLHVRGDGGEGKLVRCSFGAVHDVAVDLRPASPTYLQWQSIRLDDERHESVWLPAGVAHGFQALTETADVCYRIDRIHHPGQDVTVRFDDPDLGIPWPLPITSMSDRDRTAPTLAELTPHLEQMFGATP
jgi:dTDP-4-dehydrorhamnose 3,5-epimerase